MSAPTKLRIDPLQLLKCLSVLLAPSGGIKSEAEVIKVASLMVKFSKKLVSKCIYVQILCASPEHLLDQFLNEGGWDLIHLWLTECVNNKCLPLIKELLGLLHLCPVSLERLKVNPLPKMIKQISKDAEMQDVKEVSCSLVEKWMKVVKGDEKPNDKEKKKKVKDKSKSKEKDKSKKSSKHSKTENENPKDNVEDSSDKTSDNRISLVENSDESNANSVNADSQTNNANNDGDIDKLNDSDNSLSNKSSDNKKPSKKKTVKTFKGKFRTAGLLEEMQKTAVISRSGKNENKRPLSLPVNPPEKKLKSKVEGRAVKVQKEKNHVIEESSGFMDALMAGAGADFKRAKRKRKPSTSSETGVVVKKESGAADDTTRPLKFYQDTLNDASKEKNDCDTSYECGDDSVEGEQKSIHGDGDLGNSTDDVDMLDIKIEKEEDELLEKGIKQEQLEFRTIRGMKVVKLGKQSSLDGDNDKDMKGILVTPTINKTKKSIKWAPDDKLKQYFYFQMDETERVNVNRLKFGDMRQMEKMHERQAFQIARRYAHEDVMEEQIPWRPPEMLKLPSVVEPGHLSEEKEIQYARQLTSMAPFEHSHIVETPYEPDLELQESKEPAIIPTEDQTGNRNSVNDFRDTPWPPPKGILEKPQTHGDMSSENHFRAPIVPGGGWRLGDGTPLITDIDDSNKFVPGHIGPAMVSPISGMGSVQSHGPGLGPGPGMPNFPSGGMYGMPPMPYPQGPGPVPFPGNFEAPLIGAGPGMLAPMGPRSGVGWEPRNWSKPRGGSSAGSFPMSRCVPGMRPPNIRTKLCQHFARGNCRHGNECLFLHPGVNGPPLS